MGEEPKISDEVRDAVKRLSSALIASAHRLDTPFTNAPDKNAWKTFVKPALANLRRLVGLPAGPAQDPHPEDRCHRCEGPNVVWSAPSPLWNQVMRGGSINGGEQWEGIICPLCFVELAEEQGVADLWELRARRVHVELETVTPSGRVWDDAIGENASRP